MPDKIPVIAIFDVGKTNKKLLLFDKNYKIVFEECQRIPEIEDEDGFLCEDISSLTSWIKKSIDELFKNAEFEIAAINFSAYGASLVFVDNDFMPVAPLYNYLKPFPETLLKKFYKKYGGELNFSILTASPPLKSLNSGLQLFRMKSEQPRVFEKTGFALHLPQYISGIVTRKFYSDITSIGCHTALWDFEKGEYHEWVAAESVKEKLAPIISCTKTFSIQKNGRDIHAGIGLHDSSAALIPYLRQFTEEFVLISTGTWSISLNPFNKNPLNVEELNTDCLCYLQYEGSPVKASRLFSGNEHDQQLKRIADYFGMDENEIRNFEYNESEILNQYAKSKNRGSSKFEFRDFNLSVYDHFSLSYLDLIIDLVKMQIWSTSLILKNSPVKNIYVDGGFSNNKLFMKLLAAGFPQHKVYTAAVPQSTALGAALAIHDSWNNQIIPTGLIELRQV